MSSKTRISAKAFLAVATMAASPAAWALGLGDATVESYLNQPLKARIDLVTQDSDDLASVSAKLASAADYELIGASLEDVSVPVRFTVEDVGGDAYLLASSSLPMNSPVVRLIVEVNWSSGRMLREYTLFLDPPMAQDEAAPLPRIEQRESQPPVAVTEPAPAPVRPEAEEAAATSPPPSRQPEPRAEPASGEYGPVASGETLWGIAKDWSAGTGLGINKVMIAIQRENPEAFLNGNINLLKRGAILRMPAVSEVERISSSAAYTEVATQEEEWRGTSSVTDSSTPLISSERAQQESTYAYPDPQTPEIEPGPEPAAIEPEPEPEPDTAAIADMEPEEPAPAAETESVQPEPESVSVEPGPAAVEPESLNQLELVPPSEASELDSTYGFEESEQDGDAALAAQSLRENLARTEEELITQQQQNEYLEERIRELESRLEEARDGNVADPDMANMEQRLSQERQASQADTAEEPWYARFGIWLLGLLIAAAALAGWLFSRRSGDASGETIQEITDEAEDLLRVLEDSEPEEAEAGSGEEDEGAPEDEDEEPGDAAPEDTVVTPVRFGGSDDEADVLDEESSDPEIQLDLARAYISMGDKEAARVILEEVVANGSEGQQAEAQKMLDLM